MSADWCLNNGICNVDFDLDNKVTFSKKILVLQRIINEKINIQVSVGKNPSKLYTTCIKSVAEYCKKYGIDHIVLTELN